MTASTTPASIITEPGADADITTIWKQVNIWTWIGMGARPKNVIRHRDALQVDIYLGAGTAKRRLYIKLTPADLYDIELGHVYRRGFEYEVVEQVRDIDASNLDEALRNLYDRHRI